MKTLEQIEVFPAQVPVTRTFNFASGSAGSAGTQARIVFVKVTDSDGCYGWGEARPHPQWSYETPESLVSTLRQHLAPAVKGLCIWDRQQLHERMHAAVGRGPSTGMPLAKAALDMAVHDLCARAAGLPLRAFLGGTTESTEMPLGWTVAVKDAEAGREEIQEAVAQGFRHFNFKVHGDFERDKTLIRMAQTHIPAEGFIWTDANQSLPFTQVVRLARMLEEEQVAVIEQPLAADQMHLMKRLRAMTALPLAVDESCVSPGDFFHYAAEGLVDYYVIKLTRSGGIWPTLLQLGTACSAGYGLLVSGLSDSMVTKVAACQTAAAYGYKDPAALNGSQFMDDSILFPTKSKVEHDGSIHMDDTPGIGIEPDEDALRQHSWNL